MQSRHHGLRSCAALGAWLVVAFGCSREDLPAAPSRASRAADDPASAQSPAPTDASASFPASRRPTLDPLSDPIPGAAPELAAKAEQARARVRAAPADPDAWGELGLLFVANFAERLAVPCLAEATRLAPQEPRWWYHRALLASRSGEAEIALLSARRARDLAPNVAPAHWRLGLIAYENGLLPEAEEASRSAVAIDAKDPCAHAALAQVLLQEGEADQAETSIRAALALRPKDRFLAGLLAGVHRLEGDDEAAERVLRASYGFEDGSFESASTKTLASGDLQSWPDPWSNELGRFVVLSGARIEHEAQLMTLAGGAENAEGLLESAHRERADEVGMSLALVATYIQSGKLPEARALCEEVLAKEPEHRTALARYVEVLGKQGETDAALKASERIIAAYPTLGRGYMLKGVFLHQKRDLAGAVALYKQSLEFDARNGNLFVTIGMLELALKRWADARATFEEGAKRDVRSQDLYIGLAKAHLMLDDIPGAEAALAKVEGLPAGDPQRLAQVRRELAQAKATAGSKR
jgi:Flp pilus assembly protein TadD